MKVEFRIQQSRPVPGRPLTLTCLTRVTGEAPPGEERLPLNLALVLDRSGSMQGEKIRNLKEAVRLLMRRLRPDDVVSAVGYDHEVLTLARGATGQEGHEGVLAVLDRLHARGMTNLSGGWFQGRDLATGHRVQGGVNRILLMTDGLANQGVTHRGALTELCRAAADEGTVTTTIGFGADYDEDLLRDMAEAGGGATWYVETPDQAPGIFEEEIEGLLSLAAQHVRLRFRLAPGCRFVELHHDHPVHHTSAGVEVGLGDLYALEPRPALFRLELDAPTPTTRGEKPVGGGPSGWSPGEDISLGTLEVSGYRTGGSDGVGVRREVVEFPLRFTLAGEGRTDAEVERVRALLHTARARRDALAREEQGDVPGAQRILRQAACVLVEAAPDDEDALTEARDLEQVAIHLGEAGGFDAADLKYMKQSAWDESRARSRAKKRYYRD